MFFICLLFVILCKQSWVNSNRLFCLVPGYLEMERSSCLEFWDISQTSPPYNVPPHCFAVSLNSDILVTEWLVKFVTKRMLRMRTHGWLEIFFGVLVGEKSTFGRFRFTRNMTDAHPRDYTILGTFLGPP